MMTTTTPNHYSSPGAGHSLERRKAHIAARLRRRFSWAAWQRYLHFVDLEDLADVAEERRAA